MIEKQVAILLTCHNRKETTINCLHRLSELKYEADIYCVDDASTDGTAEAINISFPTINLIRGNGDLFWSRGMNYAWRSAYSHKEYDFYIWLNDDVFLYDIAFKELFECSRLNNDNAVISGIIQGKRSGNVIYGGFDNQHRLIAPTGRMEIISNLNGNFVLIPKNVFNTVGFIDPVYHHDIGDVDYGLMAKEKGIAVLTTRCFVASSEESLKSKNSRIRKDGVSILERFKRLKSPLGAPLRIHFHFIRKHYGWLKACAYSFYLILINIISDRMYHRLIAITKHKLVEGDSL